MSKTRYTKHDFFSKVEAEEKEQKALAQDNGLYDPMENCSVIDTNDAEQRKLLDDYYGYWKFMHGLQGRVHKYDFSRHPKGTKGCGLSKGLKYQVKHWRDRFSEESMKSSRNHLFKRLGTKARRTEEKRDLYNQINMKENGTESED